MHKPNPQSWPDPASSPREARSGVEPPRILLAEDDTELRRLIRTTLRKAGYHVTACENGINLLDHLGSYVFREQGERFALVITDIRMPGVTGMEVLEGLSRIHGVPPIVLITAFGDPETHGEAAKLGAVAVLDKPFGMSALLDVVASVVPPAGKAAGTA